MKKILLTISLLLTICSYGQNVFNYGFNTTTDDMLTAGWVQLNLSGSPSTTALWSVANYSIVPSVSTTTPANPFMNADYSATGSTCPIPLDQTGANNSFALVNYASTTSTSTNGKTISNWLISPVVNVQNGDVVTFYTRIGKYSATNTASYADNLQVRMSTNGSATINPSGGPTGIGDFTNLLVEVNPNLDLTSYPASWTQYSYTVSGLTGPTDCEFAFRYYVPNGGVNAPNSDIIGIDTFSVDRPTASASSFIKNNFTVSPNPTNGKIFVKNINNIELTNVTISEINGRVIKNYSINTTESELDITELNSGMYFLNLYSNKGNESIKIMKN